MTSTSKLFLFSLSLFILNHTVCGAVHNAAYMQTGYIYIKHYAEWQAKEVTKNRIDSISNTGKFVFKHKALSHTPDLKVEELYHDEQGFHVVCNGQTHDIEHGFVDSLIRNMDNQQLAYFQEKGRIQICQSIEGLLSLKAYVLLKGGGPITASFLYWTVKAFGYGVPAAAAGVAIATAAAPLLATGGVMGAIGGAGVAAGELGIGAASSALLAGGSAATGGAAIAGGAVIGAVGTEAASITVASTCAAGGFSGSGYVALVETGATAAGALGMACWFLP